MKDGDSEYADGIVVELNDTLFVLSEDYGDGESWVHIYCHTK